MKPLVPVPYVPLAPDQPGGEDAPFFFARFTGVTFVNPPADPPHRHTFQELILVEAGLVRHSIDGQPHDVPPHTLALIARGQVHAVDRAIEMVGWQLRFADDYLPADRDGGAWHDPLAAFARLGPAPTLALRPADVGELNAVAALIDAEWAAPDRPGRDTVLRHLLATLLIRIGRIHAARAGGDSAVGEEQRVYRAFTALLERDFAAHHDAGHYAAALGLDPDRLAAVLARLLGKTTKRVIDERLVLEAKRALRYTDRPLKEIAAALGYGDQFHLSKTFKRLAGVSPQAFRQQPGK
jgi:AraC family transcriptional regulator, transcriptional activator of pobA